MDYKLDEIQLGLDWSQLTAQHKRHLQECLLRLAPIGWDEQLLHFWFVNRKLAIVEEGDTTKFYGLLPQVDMWRLLLETKGANETWHVGNTGWQPAGMHT